jgi:hypothetical protein
MCRGSIQSRFAVAAVPAAREKKAAGPDLENTQVCIDVCQRVVSALSQGFPVDVACATAGIGRTTFYRWLERAQLPDAPQALQTFRDGVLQAKRTPKKASGPSVAKPFSAITKPAAIQRSRKAAVACVAVVGRPKSTGSLVCEACSLHPRLDYVNYRYLPAQFRSNLLETIHSLARDFPLDKKLSELAGEERCVFESLVDAIAHSSCQLSSPISFSWYGSQTSVLFTDFEFARPIIHRLAARYIRDRQRHVQAAPSPAPSLHDFSAHADDAPDASDDEWASFEQASDDDRQFSEGETFAFGLDDSPVHYSGSSDFSSDDMFSGSSTSELSGMYIHSQELPVFMPELSVEFDHMADFSGIMSFDQFA